METMSIFELGAWVYMFGWKSLITFPLRILGIALLIYFIATAISNFRVVLGWILVLGIPLLLGAGVYRINDTAGNYYFYAYPLICGLIIWALCKFTDTAED